MDYIDFNEYKRKMSELLDKFNEIAYEIKHTNGFYYHALFIMNFLDEIKGYEVEINALLNEKESKYSSEVRLQTIKKYSSKLTRIKETWERYKPLSKNVRPE